MELAMRVATAAMLAAAPAGAQEAGAVTTTQINPQAYMGLWYEIARSPTASEDQCAGGVTATYEMATPESVTVTNRCDSKSGEQQRVIGVAQVMNGNFNTFDVMFEGAVPSPGVNYVVAAASDIEEGLYQWAAVQSPEEGLGWILSRNPVIAPEARKAAEVALDEAGVDVGQMADTAQPPQSYWP